MSRIKVLDELTANQIAAGEVVERPSSVVKELVENAIDAGSTRIDVVVEDGGIKKIRVSDNGVGIQPEDVVLAFQRHATSKITGPEDLSRILTLGFRGEALPSIAAVAGVTIATRTRDSISGTKLVIRGGKIEESGETGCPPGTSIVVENIFFNTPARHKFLKSVLAEAGQISDLLLRLALANPDIAFTLNANGRNVLGTPGNGSLRDTIASVYGIEIARQMIPVEVQNRLVKISGFLGKTEIARGSRSHQTFIVNGRYIKSPLLSRAVEEGYHTLLLKGRFPVLVLALEIDPALVDVNVHPTKMEVRFGREKEIADVLTGQTILALRNQAMIPGVGAFRTPVQGNTQPRQIQNLTLKPQEQVEQAVLPLKTAAAYPQKNTNWGRLQEEMAAAPEVKGIAPICDVIAPDTTEHDVNAIDLTMPQAAAPQATEAELAAQEVEPVPREGLLPSLVPIGQINSTYIIAQGPDGLFIIDQHAAHERVIYEQLMTKAGEGERYKQELLMPISLDLTHKEAQTLIRHILLLKDLGFDIEHFSGDTFLLRSFPQGIAKGKEKDFFLDLLAGFEEITGNPTLAVLRENTLITMSCKAAIKAGQKMSVHESAGLIESLAETENPYTCPHGRPTIVHFSGYELEKKFKRKL